MKAQINQFGKYDKLIKGREYITRAIDHIKKSRRSELRVIPRVWYQKLVNQNGRSDWLAIAILGEVLNHIDTQKDAVIFFVSFEEIIEYFCKLYGVSIVCSRRALKRLEKKGLISIQDWGDSFRDDYLELNSWSIHIPFPVLDKIMEGEHESYL